ncbi:nitrate- and nitrite sensing domain-containing protein [Saccharothrix violaceirubra]|uniref:histidine kinase n=1 Tax=Saccharothrix violaceirubra TaxID=413306 RepID=A0A7W7T0N1_9PSEU|nr:nitrate- and nitrite sensing domain-containing protein [Saccharothrix violaceirubra]MBB4964419.1 signal transduction histidine kinase [Saccharothrix violaceirubra]
MRGHDDHASGDEPERIELDTGAERGTPDSGPATGTTAPADRGVARWRLRNWRLRSKLAVVLLVPALSTLTLAGLRLNTQLDDVELYGEVQRELRLSAQAAAVVDTLQLERDAAVHFVASRRDSGINAELSARASRVDTEVAKYRDVATTVAGIDEPVREAFQKSLQSLDALPALRNTTTTTLYPDVSVASAYGQIIASLAQVHRATASSLSHPDITPLSGANLALYSAKEQLFQQNAILLSTARRGGFGPNQEVALRASQSRLDAALAEFTNVASRENRQLYSDVVSGTSVDARNRLVTLSLVQSAESGRVSIGDTDVLKVGEETAALIRTVSQDIEKQADRAAADLVDAARTGAWRDAALVAFALIIAFALMAFVARSMVKPLRVLRRSAMDVARNRLPEAIKRIRTHRDPDLAAEEALVPVPITTTEEVGQVARAFDAVQREAVRLAVEQVALRANVNDMFINLSRRSQALVERQIAVIDRLEQDEQDPDQLASLFELDHLATQMRRNSENLLVLSGTTVARRVTRPVPINEVLGAAVSEVEKYARVQIAPAPELKVQGRVVNDLAHLIAELLDNATAFSKPTTKVTVRAIETRRGEVSIRIHDRGVGMQEQDVAEANSKLADPPEVDVSVAREMGLYVVGQLAKRHEIRVTLSNNDDIEGGVTAQVVLPVSLLHRGPEQPPTGRPTPPVPAREEPDVADSGVGVLAGVPKWTPDGAPSMFDAEPVPSVVETHRQEPAADFEPFRVEQTPTTDLFTATVTDSPAPSAAGVPDYTYPPLPQRPVPAAAEPEPEPEPAPRPVPPVEDEASTQRLPIYEDVLSRWFQGSEASEAPVHGDLSAESYDAGSDESYDAEPDPVSDADASSVPPESPAERTLFADRVDLVGPDTEPEPSRRTSGGLPKREPGPSAIPSSGAATVPGGWGASDDGWSAATALLGSTVDDTTTAGLPKRVPKARLVPGSLTGPSPRSATGAQRQSAGVATAEQPIPGRSADRLRQRFATYQRGIQLGRESADSDGLPWEGLPSQSDADKEQK